MNKVDQINQFKRPVQVQYNKSKDFALQQLIEKDEDFFSNSKKNDLILFTNNEDQHVHISPYTSQQESVMKVSKSNIDVRGNVDIYGNLSITENAIIDNAEGIDSEIGFLFLKKSDIETNNQYTNAIAYIHNDGMFVGGKLHVNIDFPKYDIDVGGDIGCERSIFLGRDDLKFRKNLFPKTNPHSRMYSWHDFKDTGIFHADEQNGIGFLVNNNELLFISSNLCSKCDTLLEENLHVHKNAIIDGTLIVNNKAIFKIEELHAKQDALVNSNLHVKNDVLIENNINVKNDCFFDKNVTISNDIFVKNDAFLEYCKVNNNVDINNNLNVKNDVHIDKNLFVEGNVSIQNDTRIVKNLDVEENTLIQKDLTVQKDAYFENNIHTFGDFNIVGNIKGSNNLSIENSEGLNSSHGFIFVKSKNSEENDKNNNENLQNDAVMFIHDDGLFIGGKLHVNIDFPKYDIDTSGDIGCIGNIYLGRKIIENGTFQNISSMFSWHEHKDTGMYHLDEKNGIGFLINNTTPMYISKDKTKITNNVNFGENVNIFGEISVDGDANFNGGKIYTQNDVFIKTDAFIGSNLYSRDLIVSNDVFVNRNVSISNDIGVQNDILVNRNASISNDLEVHNDIIANNNVHIFGDQYNTSNVFIGENLDVFGSIMSSNNFVVLGSISCSNNLIVEECEGLKTSETFVFCKSNSSINFENTQELNVVTCIHDDGLFVGGKLHVNIDFPKYDIDTGGDIGCAGNFYLGRNTIQNGKFRSLSSMLSWHNHKDTGIFYDESEKGISMNINNIKSYSFKSNSFKAHCDTFLESNVYVGNDFELNGDFYVNGTMYSSNELKLAGDIHTDKNVYIQNDLAIENNASVKNDVFVGKKLYVENEIQCSDSINVKNNINVDCNANIGFNLDVAGDFSVFNSAFIYNEMSVEQDLFVGKNIECSNDVNAHNLSIENDIKVGNNVKIRNDMDIFGNINCKNNISAGNLISGNDLAVNNFSGIQGSGFLFLKNSGDIPFDDYLELLNGDYEADAVAYIHDDGLFVGGKLHINLDFPKHALDVGGDIGCTHSVFIGRTSLSHPKDKGYKSLYSWANHPMTGMYNIQTPFENGIGFEIDGKDKLNVMKNEIILKNENGDPILKVDDNGQLDVRGKIRSSEGFFSSKNYFTTSDIRKKDNIKKLDKCLEKICNIHGYSFHLKDEIDKKNIGLLAQEVENNFPEAVHKDEDGFLSLSYGNLISVVIESIHEMNSKFENIYSEINNLKRFVFETK